MICKAKMPEQIVMQRGSTLIVALIMLALLTLIAISAMKSTTSSIQVVGNAQFREEAKAAAQKAIEGVLSNPEFATTLPAPQSLDVNGDGKMDYTVTFALPDCRSIQELTLVELDRNPQCKVDENTGQSPCLWGLWNIQADVADSRTGATVTLHQGVRTLSRRTQAVSKGC